MVIENSLLTKKETPRKYSHWVFVSYSTSPKMDRRPVSMIPVPQPALADLHLGDPRRVLAEPLGEGALAQAGFPAGLAQQGQEPLVGGGVKGFRDCSDSRSAAICSQNRSDRWMPSCS